MIAGSALGARALGDAGPREMISEWGGPAPAVRQPQLSFERERQRHVTIRKP